MQEFHKLLAEFTGQRSVIVIPKPLIGIAGGYEEAALLGQVVFWESRMGREFYKSLQDFSEELSLSTEAIRRCRRNLEGKGLIETRVKRGPSGAPVVYWSSNSQKIFESICTNQQMEMLESTNADLLKPTNGFVEKPKSSIAEAHIQKLTQKEKEPAAPAPGRPLAQEILVYLNEKAGRAFKPTDSTLKPILARIKEGFSAQDLKKVVDNQVKRWGRDEKMAQYLRPETLFSGKMQGYLWEPKIVGSRRVVESSAPAKVEVAEGVI